MKVYALHKLHRAQARHVTFGYGTTTEIPWPPTRDPFYTSRPSHLRASDYIEYGEALCSPVGGQGLSPELYKSVELGLAGTASDPVPMMVERFYVNHEKTLLPYMVRHRLPQGRSQTFLYLENIEKLHRIWMGSPVSLQDPLVAYLQAAVEREHERFPNIARLWWQCPRPPEVSYFGYHELSGVDITQRLERALFGTDPSHPSGGSLDLPSPSKADTLARKIPSGPVPLQTLTYDFTKSAIPLTPPAALQLETPCDLQTPSLFSETAAALDSLVLTDLDLKYILLNGELSEAEVSVAFDRFAPYVPTLTEQRTLCQRVARIAIRNLRQYLHQNADHPLLASERPMTLRIIKTFGDEAQLTFQPLKEPPTQGFSVHIDLALLGLCAPGASIT